MNIIKERVKSYNIESCVLFLGQKEDAYNYYNIFDLFIFPSIYEGLGMVAVEAQVNGLPVLASSNVPKDILVTNNVKFIDLDNSIIDWVNSFTFVSLSDRSKCFLEALNSDFNISKENYKLVNYYEGCEKNDF